MLDEGEDYNLTLGGAFVLLSADAKGLVVSLCHKGSCISGWYPSDAVYLFERLIPEKNIRGRASVKLMNCNGEYAASSIQRV